MTGIAGNGFGIFASGLSLVLVYTEKGGDVNVLFRFKKASCISDVKEVVLNLHMGVPEEVALKKKPEKL